MRMPKIIFFARGMTLTNEETELVSEIGVVATRNAQHILASDPAEKCDGVAGDSIPAQYRDKPVVKSLADTIKLMKELQKAANDRAIASMADTPVTQEKAENSDGKEAGGKTKPVWNKNA